jgi:tetratricopeptide (TPR) repeat protein
VCALVLTDARAQTQSQTATASATCSLAINASGHAVVKVSNSCDAKLAATMQKLFDLGRDTNKKVVELQQEQQRRFDELLAAVQATNQRASQKDATPLDKQAAAALEQGDATLAIALFGQAAQKEVERAKQLAQEATAANEKAAQLYRNQAALLRTKDIRKALAALEQALALEPDDFNTLWHMAHWAILVGEGERVLSIAQRMKQVAQEQVGKQPNSVEWQHKLIVANDFIGFRYSEKGDSVAALKSYSENLAIAKKFANSNPGIAQCQGDLSISYSRVGGMQRVQGDSAASLKSYSDSLAIVQVLANSDPANAEWQFDLSKRHYEVGSIQSEEGDNAAALRSYSASLAIRQKLASSDPGNTQWQHSLASVHNSIGDIKSHEQKDSEAAFKSYSASLLINQKLVSTDPDNVQWQRALSLSQIKISSVYFAQNQKTAALASIHAAFRINQKLAFDDPNNADRQVDLASSTIIIALRDTARSVGDRARMLQEAFTILQNLEAAGRLPAEAAKKLQKLQQLLNLNEK